MDADRFRPDLLSTLLARDWFAQAAPALVAGWRLDADDSARDLAERSRQIVPELAAIFAAQVPMARLLIERWGLRDVLLFGAGAPTPFSPRPDQLMYYTDSNPDTVRQASAAGYDAHVVDARNPDDLILLADAESAVAVNLFHFLPDATVASLLTCLARVGFRRFALNVALPARDADVTASWSQLGIRLYPRTPEAMRALLPPPWVLAEMVTPGALYAEHADFDGLFAGADAFSRVLLLEARDAPRQ